MQTFQLDRSMRNTVQINEVLKVAQIEITKEPNEYIHGTVQIKPTKQHIGSVNQSAHSVNRDVERRNQEDVDMLTEKMEEPNEYNHGTVQINQERKIVKPTQVTEDIGPDIQDEKKHNQDGIKINVTEDVVDITAEKMDAARRGKSSVSTVTDFIYNGKCFVGHSIVGPKPLVVFLNEPYTEDNLRFVNKVLAVFLKNVIQSEVISPRVVICNDIHGLRLLERIFSLLKNFNYVCTMDASEIPNKERKRSSDQKDCRWICALDRQQRVSRDGRGRSSNFS